MARFGALAEFEFNHLDLWILGVRRELVGVEAAILIAATKVARSHFPYQVAPMHTVVGRDGAFARVVGKTTALGACIEREDGVGAQCTKTHGRDVEYAGAVRLGRVRPNGDTKVMRDQLRGRHGVVHPFVALCVHVKLGAKRAFVRLALGALVHQ